MWSAKKDLKINPVDMTNIQHTDHDAGAGRSDRDMNINGRAEDDAMQTKTGSNGSGTPSGQLKPMSSEFPGFTRDEAAKGSAEDVDPDLAWIFHIRSRWGINTDDSNEVFNFEGRQALLTDGSVMVPVLRLKGLMCCRLQDICNELSVEKHTVVSCHDLQSLIEKHSMKLIQCPIESLLVIGVLPDTSFEADQQQQLTAVRFEDAMTIVTEILAASENNRNAAGDTVSLLDESRQWHGCKDDLLEKSLEILRNASSLTTTQQRDKNQTVSCRRELSRNKDNSTPVETPTARTKKTKSVSRQHRKSQNLDEFQQVKTQVLDVSYRQEGMAVVNSPEPSPRESDVVTHYKVHRKPISVFRRWVVVMRGDLYIHMYTSANAQCICCCKCLKILDPQAFLTHSHGLRQSGVGMGAKIELMDSDDKRSAEVFHYFSALRKKFAVTSGAQKATKGEKRSRPPSCMSSNAVHSRYVIEKMSIEKIAWKDVTRLYDYHTYHFLMRFFDNPVLVVPISFIDYLIGLRIRSRNNVDVATMESINQKYNLILPSKNIFSTTDPSRSCIEIPAKKIRLA